jgi:hypothetical protein
MMKRCEFQGGVGLEEKFRPPTPCLGEFEATTCKKYCDVCRPFANAAKTLAYGQANRAKLAKKSHRERQQRAKSSGRPLLTLGVMVRCQHRGEDGKRAPGCLRRFKRKAGAQKYCSNCKPLVKAINRKKSERKHAPEISAKASDRWETMKAAVALAKKVEAGEAVTVGADRVLRPKGGRPAEISKAVRVDQLRNEGVSWSNVQKRIAAEFKENTTENSLQRLLRRYRARPV